MSPPAPRRPGATFFSDALPLARDPIGLCAAVRSDGPVVALSVAWADIVIVHDPGAIRRVLVEHPDNYRKTSRGYIKLRNSLGNGLVTSEGDFWLRQRRIAQPAFRRQALAGFAAIMARVAEETAAGLLPPDVDEAVIDVVSPMNRLALDIVAEALFGADIGPEAAQIEPMVTALVEPFWIHTTAPYPWPEYLPRPLNWRYWRARRWLRRLVGRLVDDARRRPAGASDLLSMLMAATDPETGEAMSDAQLVDEGITLLGAGHETTANALAFALDLVARHPEVGARLAAEADAVIGDRRPDAEGIGELVYARQVLDETLRVYPPVWMLARRAVEDDVLGGFAVPAGAFVLLPTHSIHHDPAHWSEPERFDPDRFAPGADPPDRGSYLPFSRGRRQCIGDRFALMEATCALAMLARRFTFEPVGDPPALVPSLTLRPRDGIPVRLRRRVMA